MKSTDKMMVLSLDTFVDFLKWVRIWAWMLAFFIVMRNIRHSMGLGIMRLISNFTGILIAEGFGLMDVGTG